MSDSRYKSWSNNPNAPKIPYALYLEEKAYYAGTLIGSMLYGMRKRFFACPPTRAHLVLSVYPRNAHRVVLQMYDRPA